MPDPRRLLMPLIMFSTGVGIFRAVDPPWPLWLTVVMGGLFGVAVLWAVAAVFRRF
jgi:hypothetical protein